MIRVRRPVFVARHHMAGLSLIEMMIALVMALIVAAGIITVFASTSTSNKVQQQMAVLQEEGRFAIHSLTTDIANANGAYCSNTGGNAGGTGSGLFLDALRSPTVYAKTPLSFPDNTVTLATPTEAYSLPSPIFMRGYDCSKTAPCTPGAPAGLPAMGKAPGNRVVGADVLTIRFLKPGAGWAIVKSGTGTTLTSGSDGGVTGITLGQLPGEDPIADFTGTVAMLADCSNAQVFDVSNTGGVLTPNNNYAAPLDITAGAAPRVFDFNRAFQTVTYYLQVVPTSGGHTTGQLMRSVNGTPQALVRGVERLDFRYGIIDGNGGTRFLTANEIDTGVDKDSNTIACPPGVSTVGGMTGNTPASGCLWRAVQTIQVHILMDGQTPLYTLTPNEMNFIYSPDGGSVPTKPSAHPIQPNADQGFPDQLLRREFTTLVSLRNFNP